MRITPLEIRQHTFNKSFRGYDTESVDAFLLSLSQEWERISEDFRQSKQQLEIAEKEIVRMKEIENSLFKTLKAAEDAQQNINAKAEAEASLITDKARQDAEEIIQEAQKSAAMVISESENKAKFLVEEAVNDLKNYERDFNAMERYKDYLVVELKNFASDALDKVIKFEERTNSRTSEARLNELDLKVSEKIIEPVVVLSVAEITTVEIVPELFKRKEPAKNQFVEDIQGAYKTVEVQPESVSVIFAGEIEESTKPVIDTEIDFDPANDFDDENQELPTVHSIVHTDTQTLFSSFSEVVPVTETSTNSFNETADNLTKEMKATRGRPRKLTSNESGLPTVSSIMQELGKDAPATISNGGGSFFDDI